MGFDARLVGLASDAGQVLRKSPFFYSVNDISQQPRKLAREISGVDRMLRSFGGTNEIVRDSDSTRSLALGVARLAGSPNLVEANKASLYADLANRFASLSMPPGLPGFGGNFAGLSYQARIQSNVLKLHRMFGNLGPSSSVAQVFKMQELGSAYSSAWRLNRITSVRTPAMQSFLNSATTFGPIVISPDQDVSLGYHPDLQGWLIPETTTESGDAVDVEELRAQMVAILISIVRDHRTKALVRGLGHDVRMLLIQVADTVIGYWLMQR